MTENLNIEQIINKNIDVEKMGLTLVGKEYNTPLGRIDILAEDSDGYVPIEIKVGMASDSAVGQILRYMHTMKADRGIILANDFTKGVKAVSKKLNIKLIRYTIDVIVDNKSVVIDNVLSNISEKVISDNHLFDSIEDNPFENDPLYERGGGAVVMFMRRYIKITNNKNDYIKQKDIYDIFVKYCNSWDCDSIEANIITRNSFNELFQSLCNLDKPKIKTLESKSFRVYYGIKFTNNKREL